MKTTAQCHNVQSDDADLLSDDPDAKWLVVKILKGDLGGNVKFPKGTVVYAGTKEEVVKIIAEAYPGEPVVFANRHSEDDGVSISGYQGTSTSSIGDAPIIKGDRYVQDTEWHHKAKGPVGPVMVEWSEGDVPYEKILGEIDRTEWEERINEARRLDRIKQALWWGEKDEDDEGGGEVEDDEDDEEEDKKNREEEKEDKKSRERHCDRDGVFC
jgi:hypothetical protein